MSTIIDQKTRHLELPLPHGENQLADDVERIRLSLAKVDTEAGEQRKKVAAAQKTADDAVRACSVAQQTADQGVADAGAAQSAADQGIFDAARAQATADDALGKARQALETPITRALSAPVITLSGQVAIGFAAEVVLQDGAVGLCDTQKYMFSVNGSTPVAVTASGGRGTTSFTPVGTAGDTVHVSAYAVDVLGNASRVAEATATLVDVAIAPGEVLSPALGEQNVSTTPVIMLSPMYIIGNVEDVARSVQVQIAAADDLTTMLFDTGESYAAATSIPVPSELPRNTRLCVRAKWRGTLFDAGSFGAWQEFTTLSAQVLRVCQPADGAVGQSWQRIDVAGDALPVSPVFTTHPVYAGITENVIDGQRMIRFPKCFVSRETLSKGVFVGKDARGVSDIALPGYELHPAFLAKDGVTALDELWIGKYQASADGSTKAASKPGVSPLVSIDFPTMQTRCTARNTGGVAGFHLWNVHEWSLVQLLMLIEYAGTDMQTLVGRGHVDNTPSGVQAVDHTNVLQASWRGLTGIWGNIYQMCDGFRGGQNTGVMRLNMGKGFQDTTISACNTSFNPNKMLDVSGENWSARHLFIGDYASKAASTDTAAYPDTQWLYANDSNYEKVLYVGGYCSYAASAGLFFANVYYDPASSSSYIGGRLAKW